jgi:hypothetical protein
MSLIYYEFTRFVVTNMSLIYTAGALNPRAHYVSGMGPSQLNALRTAFKRMIYLDTAVAALSDVQTSPGMHLFQLYFIATDVLNSKLISCSYHFQLHGGKCSVT